MSSSVEKYDESKDSNIEVEDTGVRAEEPEIVFKAGQSKRIWNELYKVWSELYLKNNIVRALDYMNYVAFCQCLRLHELQPFHAFTFWHPMADLFFVLGCQ